jgi:HlyD family secretion protein
MPSSRLTFNPIFWLSAGLMIVVAVGLWRVFSPSRHQTNLYMTKPVTIGDLDTTVSATGTLAPLKEIDVGIEVSGTIKTVDASYNDSVKTGQVLARLDTKRLEAQAKQSKAALASAQAKLHQVQANVAEAKAKMARLQELKRLSGGKLPSQYDLISATAELARANADLASALASVEQAEAVLAVNRTDLLKAVVKSPINGIVLKRSAEPGQTVASQFQAPVLFTLAEDLKQMELQVDIDEADVGMVKTGQAATFTVDAYPDHNFSANVKQVRFGSETVDGVVTYKAVLGIDNADLSLRPGLTATATIVVSHKQGVRLIENAVLEFTPPTTNDSDKKQSLIDSLVPHPPEFEQPKNIPSSNNTQQVWTVEGGVLKAIVITKGSTNGLVTEILEGDVKIGTQLVYEQSGQP